MTAIATPLPEQWLTVTPAGLWCEPGGFYLDPHRAVDRAIITHGHSDHARAGHGHVLATAETIAIMRGRMGASGLKSAQGLRYGETLRVGEVDVTLHPAGHVLGSAQIALDYRGARIVLSGDYKRRRDPTCPPFEPVPCDVFITEATFALPVFRHPDDRAEIVRLLASRALFPDRAHLVGAYSLGKAQRMIRLIREAGHAGPIHTHGAMEGMNALYQSCGIDLGELRPVIGASKEELRGTLVLCPPSALRDRWARRFDDPVLAMASGWLGVKQRAKAMGLELPLVISDHADWDELTRTLVDVGAPRVWVTHGNEEALVHWARGQGFDAQALSLVGYGDEGGEAE